MELPVWQLRGRIGDSGGPAEQGGKGPSKAKFWMGLGEQTDDPTQCYWCLTWVLVSKETRWI